MAIGLTSASGRFVAAAIFVGELPGVPFCMRKGWTCSRTIVSMKLLASGKQNDE